MKEIINKNGKRVVLLTPSERGKKFADELRNGVKLTNDGHLKMDVNGPITLNKCERSFRSGYLTARKDNAKAFKAKLKQSNSNNNLASGKGKREELKSQSTNFEKLS